MITQKAHLSLSSSKTTPLLSHFHTFTHFCMLNYLLKNFYPTFGQKYPVSYPFYPYFRPQKCRFFVGLKCKKWGARGDNNNLYICVIFFLAFSLFKMCESVKVWKWTDFFTFFIFFREKFANTIIRIVTLQRNSEKPPGQPRNPDNNSSFSETSRCGGIEEQLRRIRGNEKAPNVTQHPLNLNLIPNAKQVVWILKPSSTEYKWCTKRFFVALWGKHYGSY